jgi:hypothetical protein
MTRRFPGHFQRSTDIVALAAFTIGGLHALELFHGWFAAFPSAGIAQS